MVSTKHNMMEKKPLVDDTKMPTPPTIESTSTPLKSVVADSGEFVEEESLPKFPPPPPAQVPDIFTAASTANDDVLMVELDENNNHIYCYDETSENVHIPKTFEKKSTCFVLLLLLLYGMVYMFNFDFPIKEIDFNNFDIADQFEIDARAYLIPESKRIGKFEKFGFYCSKCDSYMTGQIQLVMVQLISTLEKK